MTDDLKAPERICYVNCGLPADQCACYRDAIIRHPSTLEAALADMTQQRDAAMVGAALVRDGYRVDVFDLTMGGRSVPLHRALTPDLAALSRIEAQAEARGWNNAMLTAISHVAESRNVHTPGPVFKVLNETIGKIDDARFAGLRRYQNDATTDFADVEAAEARGMRKAAEEWVNVRVEGGHTDAALIDYSDHILALADATEAAAKGGA